MRSKRRGHEEDQRGALGRAMRYLWRYRTQAALPYLFLVIATLSQLAVPKLLGRLIDAITGGVIAQAIVPYLDRIPGQFLSLLLEQLGYTREKLVALAADAERTLITSALAIVAFALVRGVFAYLQTYWAERNSQTVAFDLRNDLFAKISKLSFSYHDRNQTGQLMVRATDDVEKVRLFIGQGLLQAVGGLVLLVGTLVILLTTNVSLTLVVLPILPLALIIFAVFGAVSQPLFVKVQQRLSALNTILQENLAGIKVVKAFTQERSEQQKFAVAADAVMKQQITVSRLFSFLFPLVFLIANVGQVLVLYFGGRQIIGNTLTLGQYQEFSLYLIFVFLPLAQLGIVIPQMAQASASSARIFEILDAKNEVENKPGAVPLPPVQGRVAFENVTFRYFKGGEPVLKDISFVAEPGQTIALLGATGSGKTTIINLIPRFYDPTEGRVTIDGYDLRDVTLESLRSQIGIVLQETTLFAGTIRDNIAFGRPDASQEEVEAAARAAAAHDFIVAFPDGYDTPVGERGATLSGGQRQRIAIARALLMNPRILILDDSTSAVDVETEYRIQQALDHLMQGRTSFVIAQRISTVMHADQILVLDKGRIVAAGKHHELMETSELYAEIYSSQLVEDATPEAEESLEPAAEPA
ncbi:MAG: ABC transporter ATP-binding protein/permease [Caldilineales bacterium]|nr:ABC transporter ATP-binding protein/permease [Caldilineales bacterium]MDW8316538.1 ABC transporter ATP-binding protein [Anaerolineae bacterium]